MARRVANLETWAATWGKELSTGYYLMARFLRFQEFKIHLREVAVLAMNDLLDIAGTQVGFRCTVELQHVPTRAEVAAASEQLKVGQFDFGHALEQFSTYSRALPEDPPAVEAEVGSGSSPRPFGEKIGEYRSRTCAWGIEGVRVPRPPEFQPYASPTLLQCLL